MCVCVCVCVCARVSVWRVSMRAFGVVARVCTHVFERQQLWGGSELYYHNAQVCWPSTALVVIAFCIK